MTLQPNSPIPQMITASDGVQLATFCYGDRNKPALVLVHGYPDQHQVWQRVIAHLTAQFFIIAYDVRGAGLSDHPRAITAYTLQQLSRDLKSVADQILGSRPFHLAAHDWGSIQSWESVTDPQFAGRILSFSTISGPCLDHAALMLRQVGRKSPFGLAKLLSKSWYIGVFHLPFIAPLFWKNYSADKWQQHLVKLENHADIPIDPNVTHDGEHGIKLYRANFIPRMINPRQRHAQCPVQAIVLKRDEFVSPDYVQGMRPWVKSLSVTELDSNHWALLSQPQQVAMRIADFALSHD